MKNYINFINENTLIEFLKKSFKNTITILRKDQQNKVSNYINKINTSSDFKNSITLTTEFFRSNINPNFDDVKTMKEFLKDDLISVDIALKNLSKKYNNEYLLPKKFFTESKNNLLKNVFIQDYEKDFLQNIDLSVKSITEQIYQNVGIEYKDENTQKVNESDEIEHLQNTDKLDEIENDENKESNDTEEDKNNNTEKSQEFEKIKKSYYNFQKNSLYEPIIKQLEELLKEKENTDPNKF